MHNLLLKYLVIAGGFAILLVVSEFEARKIKNALIKRRYDRGIYFKLFPIEGEKAVKVGRVALILVRTIPWLLLCITLALSTY